MFLPLRSMRTTPFRNVCVDQGAASVLVLARAHILFLCEMGVEIARYDVALGRGGLYKQQSGDMRTPVGVYRLGAGSPSWRYHRRLPIDFPNDAQKRQGWFDARGARHPFTGSDLLIHGPPPETRCAGLEAVDEDWTDGCIAVASDAFFDEIEDWARNKQNLLLHVVDEDAVLAAAAAANR